MGIIMTVPEIGSALNSFLSPYFYEKFGGLTFPLYFSTGLCILSVLAAITLGVLDKIAEKHDRSFLTKEQEELEVNEAHHSVSFKDIRELSSTFWILILICTLVLGIYIPFLDDINQFYMDRFGFSSVEAGRLIAIPYLTSVLTSPFIGNLIDKLHKRRIFIIITCFIFIASHLLFGMLPEGTNIKPDWYAVIPLVLLGTAFSFYSCSVLPCI